MISAIVAVVGTLLGALLSGVMQQRAARSERADARAEREHESRVSAVAALASAISAHRAAMWTREEARLTGAPAERIRELRTASHATRAAITDPHVRVRLLAPHVETSADTAVSLTYAMRGAPSIEALEGARETALEAHDEMIRTASAGI